MVPNASDITRRRLTAATVIRLIGFAIGIVSLAPALVGAIEIVQGNIDLKDARQWTGLATGIVVLWGAGLVLWFLAPWVAWVMIRVPRVPVCPNCRFKLGQLAAPQCNECGYTLTPEFLTTHKEREREIYEPDTIVLRQIATLIVRLGSGVFLPIACVGLLISTVEAIRRPEWHHWTTVQIWGGLALFAVTLLLFAASLSKWLIPGRARFEAPRRARGAAPARAPEADALPAG